MTFDPSVTASYKVGLFGLASTRANARQILLPIPWDATTSYGGGASRGPEAILHASPQIDLFDLETGNSYEEGYFLESPPHHLLSLNDRLRPLALKIRAELEEKGSLSPQNQERLAEVNRGCDELSTWVYWESKKVLDEGKLLGLVGGDHSTPEGGIRAVSEKHQGKVGILHIDAHADLRNAYQGFRRSHASIMYNVMHADWRPEKLVQVGIRDFCQEEYDLIQSRPDIKTFFDLEMKRELLGGTAWSLICRKIVEALPAKVYISFDIDGLAPVFCPHTGTPVPGGLDFDQVTFLLAALAKAGRQIVGFDLNEVAPAPDPEDEWDGNVGARLLYKLCGWSILTNKKGGAGGR